MLPIKRTALVWSLSVVIFVFGASTNEVQDLSTNHTSTDGSSGNKTTEIYDALSRKNLTSEAGKQLIKCECGQNSNGCSFQIGQKSCFCNLGYLQYNGTCRKKCTSWPMDLCRNGGQCKNGVCQCLPGIHGDRCEIENESKDTWTAAKKCSYYYESVCSFDPVTETSSCHLEKRFYVYDDTMDRCRESYCGAHGTCSFFQGNKRCKCEEGYAEKKSGRFREVQCEECDCGENSKGCHFQNDEKNCSCQMGYIEWYGGCRKCDCGTFGRYSECRFDDNQREICSCRKGYRLKRGVCTGCDCGLNTECKWNDNGGQVCSCKKGYEMSGGACIDINECRDRHICPPNSQCKNTEGSYECVCNYGYRPDSDYPDTRLYGCIDIDECDERNECVYRDTSDCINTQGSYYCECKAGYYTESSRSSIEFNGCQKDHRGWKSGSITLLVMFPLISFGLIIGILRRKVST